MREVEQVRALGALASPSRLHLLRQLRTPKALGEIEVQAELDEDSRHLSRQVVRRHLDRLLEAGMVTTVPSDLDGRSPVQYVVNHQALFVLSEEIRELAQLRPSVDSHLETREGLLEAQGMLREPCLVIVRGLKEGTVFRFSKGTPVEGWVLGRSRDAPVSLDFDPYVSAENARILPAREGHLLEDLPGSRNGTTLNFRPLPKSCRMPLRHGDVIGVGRTLLLYRRE